MCVIVSKLIGRSLKWIHWSRNCMIGLPSSCGRGRWSDFPSQSKVKEKQPIVLSQVMISWVKGSRASFSSTCLRLGSSHSSWVVLQRISECWRSLVCSTLENPRWAFNCCLGEHCAARLQAQPLPTSLLSFLGGMLRWGEELRLVQKQAPLRLWCNVYWVRPQLCCCHVVL